MYLHDYCFISGKIGRKGDKVDRNSPFIPIRWPAILNSGFFISGNNYWEWK